MNQIQTGSRLVGFLYVCIVVAILVAAMLAIPQKTCPRKAFLNDQEVCIAIADTALLREKGLSGYQKLEKNEGMLFIFDTPEQQGFWMKDMLFPVDIIWFDESHRIIDVWLNATPSSYPQIVSPNAPAKFVLEVPAGFFEKYHLYIGDFLKIPQ